MLRKVFEYAWRAVGTPFKAATELVKEHQFSSLVTLVIVFCSVAIAGLETFDSWTDCYIDEAGGAFCREGGLGLPLSALSCFVVFLIANLLWYPVAVFLWKYLFMFKDQGDRVSAALSCTYLFSMIGCFVISMTLILGSGYAISDHIDNILYVYFLILFAASTIYFATSLKIGFLRAAATNAVVMVLLAIPYAGVAGGFYGVLEGGFA